MLLLLHFCFPIHSPIYFPFSLTFTTANAPTRPTPSYDSYPLPSPSPSPSPLPPSPNSHSFPFSIMNPNMFRSNNNTQTNQIALEHQEQHEENLYLHFPHPFLDHDDLFLTHILSQHFFIGADCWEQQEQEQEHDPKIEVVKKKKKCSRDRKKTGKKDRHSKIYTAQGPRDRRMRLSLQIARKFFDLQDMLGFDKASSTIEWLLSNSTSAIKDLQHSLTNNNSNSGHRYGSVCCGSTQAVSEMIRDTNGGGGAAKEAAFMPTLKHKQSRPLRRVGRESRDRARARARQRTMLKKTKQPISNLQHVSSVVAISDDPSGFPSIQSILSGNHNSPSQNPDSSTLACPNSTFMPSPIYY